MKLSLLHAFTYLISPITPKGKFYYTSQFTDKEAEMQNGKVTCLRAHTGVLSARARVPVLESSGASSRHTSPHPEEPLAFPSLSSYLVLS